MIKRMRIIGTMSGTSLDGFDIAYCEFEKKKSGWTYEIKAAKTFGYDSNLKKKLENADLLDAQKFVKLDVDLGIFMANKINQFLKKNALEIDFISSHGHTIFHQPSSGITCQIGNGAVIAAQTGYTTVCDFRKMDVALRGQGAPLVPVGDELLFGDYDACLNLGGFANISFQKKNKRLAYDICPVNLLLNHCANKLGFDYDKGGNVARNGKLICSLLKDLNSIKFYQKDAPKSLGKEWLVSDLLPKLELFQAPIEDKLRTACEHIAIQIGKAVESIQTVNGQTQILVTGGGTFNKFLIERIKQHTDSNLIIPSKNVIEFKEALIFAFLGLLRMKGEINCLKSVTGSISDNIGGCVYMR